ncbi:hypothetical protein EV182_000611 [Spiromyces aspiralis]|uniref:Uncharacterized protein n=1 Tax=Spiromyces aspiralis TaxID=68401 RepID=A0ACC1HWK7_9FUNG|nr:hypothetical protein EV182_000611 [Spiromyces aspiralis]
MTYVFSGITLVECVIVIITYYFIFWWDRRLVDRSIIRQTLACQICTAFFAIITILVNVLPATELRCRIVYWLLQSVMAMFNWLCFFVIFNIQLSFVHRVRHCERLEKWFYLASFVLAFIPTMYPMIDIEHGYRIWLHKYCGFKRYGDARAFVLRWCTQLGWIVLAEVLTATSTVFVFVRIWNRLRSLQLRNLRHNALAREYPQLPPPTITPSGISTPGSASAAAMPAAIIGPNYRPLVDTSHARVGNALNGDLLNIYHHTNSALQSLHYEYSARTVRAVLQRLIWFPVIPAACQILYLVITVAEYAANSELNGLFILSRVVILLQGSLILFWVFTDPMNMMSLRVIKSQFVFKWYDEQQEYWLSYLRKQDPHSRRPLKRQAHRIREQSLLGPRGIPRPTSKSHEAEFRRRPEFEGLWADIAYWLCATFFI